MIHNKNRFKNQREQPKEEFAIILDVVLESNSSFKDNEIAQAIGTSNFTLLELVPKPGVILRNGQKVYIGDGKRDEIQYIKRALYPDKLTGTSKSELLFTIMDIVNEKEEDFIRFFNLAGPITIRKHSLELIPGIGKKHLTDLLEERNKPFESFENIKERCHFFSDPQKAIAERILIEIEGKDEVRLFVRK